jgi:uncharacterized protein (TIGR03086 family)
MTTTTTSDLLDSYRAADGPLSAVVASLTPDQWAAPSPCEGWTAADVLGHVVDTQRSFLTDRGVTLGPAPDVAADPAGAWATHRDEVLDRLADPSVAGIEYDGHFGRTTVGDTLVRFYVFDMVAHRWDIATAAGRDERFTDAELDQLEAGIEGFGPAVHMEGVCKPGVEAPEGADRQSRVLATMGRVG